MQVDLPVDGRYRYAMANTADGTQVETGGVYREIEPPSRLTFTREEPDAGPERAPVLTPTFTSEGEGTLLTLELRGVGGHPGDGFFYDGWESTLDSLAGHQG